MWVQDITDFRTSGKARTEWFGKSACTVNISHLKVLLISFASQNSVMHGWPFL